MKLVAYSCLLAAFVGSACVLDQVGPMLVLASRMEGTLVDKDLRPVPNVRVTRTWDWGWNGRKGSDVCMTDDRGRFEFPQVKRLSLTAAVLPHQPQVTLNIIAEQPGRSVLLFETIKQDYADQSEMQGRPFNIVCRLDLEPGRNTGFWGTVIEVK